MLPTWPLLERETLLDSACAGVQLGVMVVSASLGCQQGAQAQQSAHAAEDAQCKDSMSTPEPDMQCTGHATFGRAVLDQLPALRLLADEAVQTMGQDVPADTTEKATQTAAASALSNHTMPQLQSARGDVANGDRLRRGPQSNRSVLANVGPPDSVPGHAGQQDRPERAGQQAKQARGLQSRYLSPAQHMSLPSRPPPVRTQLRSPPRAPAPLQNQELVEHSAHGSMASPRGWHQQWRIAAYAQHNTPRAPSSRGHGDQLAEAVAAEYDALERHMDAVHDKRKRHTARRRGLEPISEGSTSRPRSPGSTVGTARRRRRQQPSTAPSLRHLACQRDVVSRHELGTDSPQTPVRRRFVHGLPEPARAGPGRVPQLSAEGAFLNGSARGDVHHSESQPDELPSPVAAAGSSLLQLQSESRHGRDSTLDQLQSASQLADAIAERLATRLADQAADKLNKPAGVGQPHAGSTGSPARSQQRSPGPPRPASPSVEAQQRGSVTIVETVHDQVPPEDDSVAPTGQGLHAAELRSALVRLCDVATAHACLPHEPTSAMEEVPGLAWKGLIELTRVWGSPAETLSHDAAGTHPRTAADVGGDLSPEKPAQSAQLRSRQHEQDLIAESVALQLPTEGAVTVPQAGDSADAGAYQPSQGVAQAVQPRDTAPQTQRLSQPATAAEAQHAPALRLLRAPAEVVLPSSTSTAANASADVAPPSEVCPKCRRRQAPGRKAVDGRDPVHAGKSTHSGGACSRELLRISAKATAAEGARLMSSGLCEHHSNNIALSSECEAPLYQSVASASTDSEENRISESGKLADPGSPLSAVSAADAETLALLDTHD